MTMTREEAIQWLKNEKWGNANNKYKKEWNEAFDLAISALSAEAEFTDLPDIPRYYYEKVVGNMAHEINMLKEQLESAEAVQGWIPCSERLPKVGENVLFTTDIYGGYVAEGDRRADGKWWQYRWNALLQNDEVTAWMPLPTPYKGGDDE